MGLVLRPSVMFGDLCPPDPRFLRPHLPNTALGGFVSHRQERPCRKCKILLEFLLCSCPFLHLFPLTYPLHEYINTLAYIPHTVAALPLQHFSPLIHLALGAIRQ